MSRTPQPEGARGSLKWIQRAIERGCPELNAPILAATGASAVEWRSPVRADAFAEYRDSDFLSLIGAGDLAPVLRDFWPTRGPQWDALGVTNRGDILLVEAKAHVGEMLSPPTGATGEALQLIERALASCAAELSATPKASWSQCFYQYANRLAHLAFLRQQGRPAWLVLVSFVGDDEMGGPRTPEAWAAAYSVMDHVMGLRARHRLSRWIVHAYPDVSALQ